jgi:hypothetical protein
MNTYSVKKGQMGDTILEIDGVQSVCPFTQPLMAQGNMGQVQILRMPCTSACPLANFTGTQWKTYCGYTLKMYNITETIEEPQEPSKLIIV